MRVHALSALSLAGLATTAAANQLDGRQQTTDGGSFACLSSIMALAEASPTVPAALSVATHDCVPSSLTAAASSFTSDANAWYTSIVDAVSACPAWPSESKIPALGTASIVACTGEQPSSAATAATTTSASSNAVATSTNPTKSSTNSVSAAASGTGSATTSAGSSAASGSAGRSATTSSSQTANAAARETGVVFAAVAMAAFGAAAL
ncbi:hypothetical protein BBO_09180 [Beauveria brongniartii RCEF 3172]|uniref:Infection structure specific protein n=1 Tax=Beauveria brongniartii RCEF 3172 TaxID=1081107 RepID=A0A166WAS8_9HYPO|nr:hypothetical protein BBO_09180 [Beauveria brongniartii RCEF 3172]